MSGGILKPVLGSQIQLGHPLAQGLVAAYLMNEGSGNVAQDLSGNKYRGTISTGYTWVGGETGPAIRGDNTNAHCITIPCAQNSPADLKGQGTIIVKIRPNSDIIAVVGRNDQMYLWTHSTADKWTLRIDSDVDLIFVFNSVDWGQCQTMAATYDDVSGDGFMYKNGALIGSSLGNAVNMVSSAANWYIGEDPRDGTGMPLNGDIEYVFIYNRALSASEITELYSNPFGMFERPSLPLIIGAMGGGTGALTASVTDNIGIADNVTMRLLQLHIDVADNIGLADNITARLDLLKISVEDDIGIADNVSATRVEPTLTVDVEDDIGVADNVTVRLTVLKISVEDSVGVADNVSAILDLLSIDVTDNIGVADNVTARLLQLHIDVADNIGIADNMTAIRSPLEVNVSDSVGIADNVSAIRSPLEVNVSDSVGIADNITARLDLLKISVTDNVGVADSVAMQMKDWVGISSSHYVDHCGEEVGATLADALDGTDYWGHEANEDHWFILDLGNQYNITKVRGRSEGLDDPVDIDIYVCATNPGEAGDWGVAVATAISWTNNDGGAWDVGDEEDTTDKEGRYILVKILDTEDNNRDLLFGSSTPFTIFDVYGYATSLEYDIDVEDNIGVADNVTVRQATLFINVSDSVGIADNVTIKHRLYVNVTDNIGVAEEATARLAQLKITATDSIGLADSITTMLTLLKINVGNNIGLSDNISCVRLPDWQRPTDASDAEWTKVTGDSEVTWSKV